MDDEYEGEMRLMEQQEKHVAAWQRWYDDFKDLADFLDISYLGNAPALPAHLSDVSASELARALGVDESTAQAMARALQERSTPRGANDSQIADRVAKIAQARSLAFQSHTKEKFPAEAAAMRAGSLGAQARAIAGSLSYFDHETVEVCL